MPNLEWLRSFVVFAEHLNFTRAAEALHLSQPALHVQVKKLAEQLGVTLYERRGRGLALTPDGRRVLAFGRELLARCERFSDDLRGAPPSRAPRGPLRRTPPQPAPRRQPPAAPPGRRRGGGGARPATDAGRDA